MLLPVVSAHPTTRDYARLSTTGGQLGLDSFALLLSQIHLAGK